MDETLKEWNDEQVKRKMTGARQRAASRFPGDQAAQLRYVSDELHKEAADISDTAATNNQ